MKATEPHHNDNKVDDVDAELYLGIMSGTSLDGLDVGLFHLGDSIATLAHEHIAYSGEQREEIKRLCESEFVSVEQLMEADSKLAILSAECVNRLLRRENRAANSIKAIGSHGQTIRHRPPSSNQETSDSCGQTLQIGDPNTLAALTNIPVVADFRRADMARGGQGAPLAPAFHHAAFGANGPSAVVNIGGMSNISVLGQGRVIGFDCGPGNALMDAWIQRQRKESYDNSGQWAASGTVSSTLLNKLMSHEFFAAPAPKSTGREQFNEAWLAAHLQESAPLAAEDVQATLLELTATSIANCVRDDWKIESLVVCGGGAHNKHLMIRLAQLLPAVHVSSSARLGIDPELVECCAFAWFAQQTLKQRPIPTKDFTGANSNAVLGGLYLANR